jgi:hypothetical protein
VVFYHGGEARKNLPSRKGDMNRIGIRRTMDRRTSLLGLLIRLERNAQSLSSALEVSVNSNSEATEFIAMEIYRYRTVSFLYKDQQAQLSVAWIECNGAK